MLLEHQRLPVIRKEKVRGGVGELLCRDYLAGDEPGHPFAALGLNEMQPGATIAEHRHQGEAEFYFVTAGRGTGLHQGRRFAVGPGDAWLCRDGETHGIENTSVPGQVLSFVSIFFRPPKPA